MFPPPFTNVPSQWRPAAPAFAWPGVPSYQFPTQYQHRNTVDMSRGRDALYGPNCNEHNWRSPADGSTQDRAHPGQRPRNPLSQPSRQSNTAQRVSPTKIASLLAWLEYRGDNTNQQTQTTIGSNLYIVPQNVAQNLYPAVLPPRPAPYAANSNPQARSLQIPQSTQSRYDTRSRTNAQLRHYNSRSADQVVQSIEAQDTVAKPRYPTPPWRGGRRQSTPLRATPARDDPERPITPPPEPVVSRIYLSRAHTPPQRLPRPQKLLVVLDLNGTLCAREPGNSSRMIKRPGVDALFEYLFTNHVVMVCTSATGKNANFMVNKLLTAEQREKLVTIRPRHTFGLTPAQYASKVQIYKNLEDIWKDPIVDNAVPPGQAAWSMANTVLIDDSVLKAKAQPHNLVQVPEFEWEMTTGKGSLQKVVKAREEKILKSVQEKLEVLKQQVNVASLIRLWREGEKAAPDIDEKVDQGRQAALTEDYDQAQSDGAEIYPTPTSSEATPGQESQEKYEPPEAVELVFRGRKQVAQNIEAAEGRCEPAKQQAQREPSPVTEQDFDWLKK